MNVINTETQLPENGDYLVEVKWPLTEGFPRGNVIRGLTGELQEAILNIIVEVLEFPRNIQKIRMVELAELLRYQSGQLLFFSPEGR